MIKQLLEELIKFVPHPYLEDAKKWLSEALAQQKAELKKLITEEIVTCQKTGEPTSRLTSLYNKI